MLDAHPLLSIAPETHFYTQCRSEDCRDDDSLDDLWCCLQQQIGVQDMHLTEAERERIWEQLEQMEAPGPPDLLRALCITYADRDGAVAWGEKTPDHFAHVPTIMREFPEAFVLCIVRDPRDVCLSLRGMPWNRDALPESARKWKTYAEQTDRYRQEYPDRFRVVRYEDLLDEPERRMREVLSWIGAPFDEGVLSYHQREQGPVDAEREPWKAKTRRPLDPTNKEKWRTQMPRGERWIVQRLTTPQLLKWGYEAQPVSIGPAWGRDLVRVLIRSARTVAGRILRRWRTPPREPGDHRPTWLRRKQLAEEGKM
jgi:hypothetical protein